nr:nicotinate-nucleotide adenylyltransferase [Prochlorococcus marinus]
MVSPIALLGTSADPPTYGHQALLKGLSNLFPKVVTWASDNPMKNHCASLTQRHELLKTLVKDLAIPHLEIKQELSHSQTIKSIDIAIQCWPGSELVLIIGSDLTEQVPNWVQSKDLLSKARLGIAPREGWPVTKRGLKVLKSIGAKVDVLPLTLPATSSSRVRTKPEPSQIPKSILPLLKEANLYGLSINGQ